MDLNKIIQDYKISKEGGVKELENLQEILLDVPVNLENFEKKLKSYDCEFTDMIIRAEFYNPQTRLPLLDELVDMNEADRITEQMRLPHPIIYLNGQSISGIFTLQQEGDLGKLILPDKKDITAKVISSPFANGVAIMYERNENLHYVEMILTKEFL